MHLLNALKVNVNVKKFTFLGNRSDVHPLTAMLLLSWG
jgi:hypothetical protein